MKRFLFIAITLTASIAWAAPATTQSADGDLQQAFTAYQEWWYKCAPYPGEKQRQLIHAAAEKGEPPEALFWESRDRARFPEPPLTPAQSRAIHDLTTRAAKGGMIIARTEAAAEVSYSRKVPPGELEEAKKELISLAEQNQPDALAILGQIYREGTTAIPRDLPQSEKMLRVASLLGVVRAYKPLAKTLMDLNRFDDALTTLERGAKAGDPAAQLQLGQWFRMGLLTPTNIPRAQELFRQAADKGHPEAQIELATLLAKSDRKEEQDESVRLMIAASDHNQLAKFRVAQLYLYGGFGTDIDLKRAEALLRELADAEMPQANLELGKALIAGIWLPKDTVTGVKCLEAALRAGNDAAGHELKLYRYVVEHNTVGANPPAAKPLSTK